MPTHPPKKWGGNQVIDIKKKILLLVSLLYTSDQINVDGVIMNIDVTVILFIRVDSLTLKSHSLENSIDVPFPFQRFQMPVVFIIKLQASYTARKKQQQQQAR